MPLIVPVKGHYWYDRKTALCADYDTNFPINEGHPICVFSNEPKFNIRGLCKDAVMDTQYKLGKHGPGGLGQGPFYQQSETAHTRSYVGPKGWVIARDPFDKTWRMTHYHYKDKTLTMLDKDMLPLGRHKWLIENNVCSEGKTIIEVLQMRFCDEHQFTCDDGKCIDMSQRCNNLEAQVPIFKMTVSTKTKITSYKTEQARSASESNPNPM